MGRLIKRLNALPGHGLDTLLSDWTLYQAAGSLVQCLSFYEAIGNLIKSLNALPGGWTPC